MWTLCRREKSLACVGIRATSPWFPSPCPSYYTKYTIQATTFLSKTNIIFVANTWGRQRFILPLWETVWVNIKDKIIMFRYVYEQGTKVSYVFHLCFLVFCVATKCSLMGDAIAQQNTVRNPITLKVSDVTHCIHIMRTNRMHYLISIYFDN
jgi:hypothetical protein